MRNTANQEKCSVTTRHDPRWTTVVSRDPTADGHRVVRTNGELSGYRWGIERKRALLEREAHT